MDLENSKVALIVKWAHVMRNSMGISRLVFFVAMSFLPFVSGGVSCICCNEEPFEDSAYVGDRYGWEDLKVYLIVHNMWCEALILTRSHHYQVKHWSPPERIEPGESAKIKVVFDKNLFKVISDDGADATYTYEGSSTGDVHFHFFMDDNLTPFCVSSVDGTISISPPGEIHLRKAVSVYVSNGDQLPIKRKPRER